MDYDVIIEQRAKFNDLVKDAVSQVKEKIEEHFSSSAWTDKQLEMLMGKPAAEKLDIQNALDYTELCLEELMDFADECGIDVSDIKVPYKIIILNDGPENEYSSLDCAGMVSDMLYNEENISEDTYEQYVICQGEKELFDNWKKLLEKYEGSWYSVSNDSGILLDGVYDPCDIEDIEYLCENKRVKDKADREMER